jgi:hypothetical protein
LLGWGWTSCIHPDDAEAFVQKMNATRPANVRIVEMVMKEGKKT